MNGIFLFSTFLIQKTFKNFSKLLVFVENSNQQKSRKNNRIKSLQNTGKKS